MITKWIEFTVQEDNTADFKAALVILEEASKAEQGCVKYTAYQSSDEPTLFTVLESWATKDDFENHRVAPHTGEFKEKCGSMILSKKGIALNPVA